MLINYFALKSRIESYGISKNNSKKIIKAIRKMDPELKKAFGKWYINGMIPKGYVEGITFDMLVNSFHMNEINAFLTLDWLKREPVEATAALGSAIDMIIVNPGELSEKTDQEQTDQEQTEDTGDINIEE